MLGGLNDGFASMDIFFFSESEKRKNAEWEEIKELTPDLKQSTDMAGDIIIEQKKHLSTLNDSLLMDKSDLYAYISN